MIFNWKQNSLQILQTGKYSEGDRWEKKKVYRQQIEFVAYLVNLGWKKKDIYDKWLDIPNEALLALDQYEIKKYFDVLYTKGASTAHSLVYKMDYSKEHYIYKEELDAINKLNTSEDFKRYLLVLLGIYKFYYDVWGYCFLDHEHRGYAWETATGKVYGDYSDNLMKLNQKCGRPIASQCTKKGRFSNLTFFKEQGTLVLTFKEPKEVLKLLDEIEKPTKICPVCGTKFEVNSKTKREICQDCYNLYRHEKDKIRKKEYMRRFRAKQKAEQEEEQNNSDSENS